MARYDQDWLRGLLHKPGYAVHPGDGKRPVLQEREDENQMGPNNGPKETGMDEEGRSMYRIFITLRVSDNRDRDGDGAVSTVLDTYLFAIGRFLEMDRRALRTLAKSEERRRRGGY